jgi:hypothetical protein
MYINVNIPNDQSMINGGSASELARGIQIPAMKNGEPRIFWCKIQWLIMGKSLQQIIQIHD